MATQDYKIHVSLSVDSDDVGSPLTSEIEAALVNGALERLVSGRLNSDGGTLDYHDVSAICITVERDND